MWMKASKALTMIMPVFRGRIPWSFSLSKINIAPAAPDLELILFPLWYWPIMKTHTKQQDKVFETDFIGSQNPHPPQCAPSGTKWVSHIYIYGGGGGGGVPCLKVQYCHRPVLFNCCLHSQIMDLHLKCPALRGLHSLGVRKHCHLLFLEIVY